MSPLQLTQIYSYPIKSCRGISHERLSLDRRGLHRDRRWMLVDSNYQFITQRQLPNMSLLQTQMADGQILVDFPEQQTLALPVSLDTGPRINVRVWDDECLALEATASVNDWFSRALGRQLSLVYMPEQTERQVDQAYARATDITGFSDGFPLLLISEASLEDLNNKLDHPLTMQRFRPNLVVQGCAPYAEDEWRRIRIGPVEFDVVKPCSRCIITTIDPDTGQRATDSEPLRTLSLYRRQGNKVFFGQNLIHRDTGILETGTEIEILESS